jgi:Asp-tRNA(Asn)/Glu-tRNA(Gln) amidotransferase A subunit family amidase
MEGNLSAGVQLMGRSFSEGLLLDMAEAFETAHPFPHPAEYKTFWRPAL